MKRMLTFYHVSAWLSMVNEKGHAGIGMALVAGIGRLTHPANTFTMAWVQEGSSFRSFRTFSGFHH